MLLLPAFVANSSCWPPSASSIRLFGAASPSEVPRTRPLAVSSKLPLPMPSVG